MNKKISLPKEIWSKEAVHRTLCDLKTLADFTISSDADNYNIELLSPHDIPIPESSEIQKMLCEHQVRLDLEKKLFPLRNLLIARAIGSSFTNRTDNNE